MTLQSGVDRGQECRGKGGKGAGPATVSMATRTIADSPEHGPTYFFGLTLPVSEHQGDKNGGWVLPGMHCVTTSVSHPAPLSHLVLVSLLALGVRAWVRALHAPDLQIVSLGPPGLSLPQINLVHTLPLRTPELTGGRI